ncbi:MAG: hypothetical protein PHQ98_02860, partial [Candidatus ainarchaeum sp.]|nr:hypothetical protein [Candidatus ainarchaeum sp.]
MGITDKLKEIYFSLEDKWYQVLDKIDTKIPIYKIIEPIDNVVPSFALFIIFLLLFVLIFGLVVSGIFFTEQAYLTLSIQDNLGKSVDGAKVTLEGINQNYTTNAFGLTDKIPVTLGQSYIVNVSKDGVSQNQELVITEKESSLNIKLNLSSPLTINMIFKSSSTNAILNSYDDLLNLTYNCSNSNSAPSSDSTRTGQATVTQPSSCGVLRVTVASTKYQTKTMIISNKTETITLDEKVSTDTGYAKVRLYNEGVLIASSIRVSAFLSNNIYSAQDYTDSYNGVAELELPVGDYYFETSTSNGYSSKKSSVITITKNETKIVDINLVRDVTGKIKVEVRYNGYLLNGASVILKKGSETYGTKTTDTNGTIIYELTEDGTYYATATKSGYCQDMNSGRIGDTIKLNLVYGTNCGSELKAKVLDSGKAVPYAKVVLFTTDTDGIKTKTSYYEVVTDYNGVASFGTVDYSETGTKYSIFAFKGAYNSWSSEFEFTAQNKLDNLKVINLTIPVVQVKVTVKDTYKQPVQYATVKLYENYGYNLISQKLVENSDGTVLFDVKSGQTIFAVVSYDEQNYESFMSLPVELTGNQSVTIDTELTKPQTNELKVEYLGLYKDDLQAISVQANQEYTAMFKIIVPQTKDYDSLGFFLMTGENNVTKTEYDKLYIKELLAPGPHTELKGAQYNPPKGYRTDEDYLGLEESKWIKAEWNQYDFEKGQIMVGVKVRIKENANLGDTLKLNYRAYGIDGGRYDRTPTDDVLGTSAYSSEKQDLYAGTALGLITVGQETLCDTYEENEFCLFSTYTDSEGITQTFTDGFDAKTSANYNLEIGIINQSEKNFEDVSLKFDNTEENILLKNLRLIRSDSTKTDLNINAYKTSWINNGYLLANGKMTVKPFNITPDKTGSGTIELSIRDAHTILLKKNINLNIISNKEFGVEYFFDDEYSNTAPQIVPGKTQDLTLRLKNSLTGLEVENAKITLKDRFGNVLTSTMTSTLGIGTITIPASLPSEKLSIVLSKEEFMEKKIDLAISKEIVDVSPSTLDYTIDIQSTFEDSQKIKITNKTGFELRIKNVELTGHLKGLIDESQTDGWLSSLKGTKILSNNYEEVDLKVYISNNIPSAADLDGKFIITLTNGTNDWVREIDSKIRVGVGKDVDTQTCLEVTGNNWTATSEGEILYYDFTLTNNCRVDGTPVLLKNVSAELQTTGNVIGSLSVATSQTFSKISNGYSRVFINEISPDATISGRIRFDPYGGVAGVSEGTIIFKGINQTDSTDQEITTELPYKLNMLNLKDCLVIGADLVTVESEGTGSLSIINNCTSNATINVEVDDVTISEKDFSLTAGETKDLTITRMTDDLPGAYNLIVNAREGSSAMTPIGNVTIIYESNPNSCFSLTRYEYDVFDSPLNEFDGYDTGYVINSCTQRTLSVGVEGKNEFSWTSILRNMLLSGVAGFAAGKGDLTTYEGLRSRLLGNWLSGTGEEEKDVSLDKLVNKETATLVKLVSSKDNANKTKINSYSDVVTNNNSVDVEYNQKLIDLKSEYTNKINLISQNLANSINLKREKLLLDVSKLTTSKEVIKSEITVLQTEIEQASYQTVVDAFTKEADKLKAEAEKKAGVTDTGARKSTENNNTKTVDDKAETLFTDLEKNPDQTKINIEKFKTFLNAVKLYNPKNLGEVTYANEIYTVQGDNWKLVNGLYILMGTTKNNCYNSSGEEVDCPSSESTAHFLLATNVAVPAQASSSNSGLLGGNLDIAQLLKAGMGGLIGGNALSGSLIGGVISMFDGSGNKEYPASQESFTVDLVKFISATLTSEGGVTLQVAEAPTYDYDNYYQALA